MKRAVFGAAMVLALGAGNPVAAQETAVSAETVVATVNGRDITLGHMIVLREQLPPQYQALPDDTLFKGILDQLIQQAALEQSVEGSLALRDRLALENDRRGYMSGVALRAVVDAAVTDEALQAAYDARFKDATPGTEYSAAHILVETEEKANELKAQIDGGADFAELARANSTDPGSGPNGGDLGWFGLGMMVKPFEEAVVALQPGQVSAPVQSQFGWHIVRLNETRTAGIPTLDDMRAELASEIERAAVTAHITAITEAATVARPGEGIDPTRLRDLTLLEE
jgi:peptidyl-prolyl cis-trans isomerase C